MSSNSNRRVRFVEGIYNDKKLAKYYMIYATPLLYFALCFGKVVITSAYGNAAEYVVDEVNDLVYNYGSVQKLVKKLDLFLKNPDLCRKYGAADSNWFARKLVFSIWLIQLLMLSEKP